MVTNFHRKAEVMKLCGYKTDSHFFRDIQTGKFPKADAYIGPRTPVWTSETVATYQRNLIASAKSEAVAA